MMEMTIRVHPAGQDVEQFAPEPIDVDPCDFAAALGEALRLSQEAGKSTAITIRFVDDSQAVAA